MSEEGKKEELQAENKESHKTHKIEIIKNEDKEDEDISIDLSKIKNFFKKKHAEHKEQPKIDINKKEEKDEDDEISIDFSKIKKWFKSEEGEKKEPLKFDIKKKEDEEDISIDFGKIKDFFKGGKNKTQPHHHKEDEDISIDLKGIWSFIKKHQTFLLLLAIVLFTLFIRMQPANLGVTDTWAESTVHNYYRQQIMGQISQQYPNLPDANKNKLVEAEFQKILEQNKDMIKQQTKDTSNQIKTFFQYESNGASYQYLGDIDSYYYLRQARNLLEKGSICDQIEKGVCYDTYTLAPLKLELMDTLHPHSIVFVYKILKVFSSSITLMQASFYTPAVFAILAAIFAFLIGRIIGGNIGGFFASILVTTSPVYLSRSFGSDTDIYNVFFPLMIVFFFLKAFESKDYIRGIIYASLTGISIGAFGFTWLGGWWFIFDFLMICMIGFILFIIIRHLLDNNTKNIIRNKEIMHTLIVAAAIFVFTCLIITVIYSFSSFSQFYSGPFDFMQSKYAANPTAWPNVKTTVAEFNPASLSDVVGQVGGKLLFFLALLGTVMVMLKKEKVNLIDLGLIGFAALIYLILTTNYGLGLSPLAYLILMAIPLAVGGALLLFSKKEVDIKFAILLVMWFIATTYAATKGIRFTLLLIPTFAVAFSVTASYVYSIVSNWLSKKLDVNEILSKVVIFVIFALIILSTVKAGYNTSKTFMPNVDDAWYNTLTKIKDYSKDDAIINSWWDFGHWFKYYADRRVTLDGSSQNSPVLHWLGKSLLTSDEKASIGMLRMMDCGSNTAFDELDKTINNTPISVDILNEIIKVDKQQAANILKNKYKLNNEQANNVLKYSHCDAPEDYFITSEDMIGKSGVWAHFGSWDFDRATVVNYVTANEKKEATEFIKKHFELDDKEAGDMYNHVKSLGAEGKANEWIAPWPGYYSGLSGCLRKENIITCNGGIMFDLDKEESYVMAGADKLHPNTVSFIDKDGNFRVIEYNEELMSTKTGQVVGISIIPQGDNYISILMHPALVGSMFNRLFFYKGEDLKCFDAFDYNRQMAGGDIYTWKVDWNCKDANNAFLNNEEKEELLKAVKNESITNNTINAVDKNETQ